MTAKTFFNSVFKTRLRTTKPPIYLNLGSANSYHSENWQLSIFRACRWAPVLLSTRPWSLIPRSCVGGGRLTREEKAQAREETHEPVYLSESADTRKTIIALVSRIAWRREMKAPYVCFGRHLGACAKPSPNESNHPNLGVVASNKNALSCRLEMRLPAGQDPKVGL